MRKGFIVLGILVLGTSIMANGFLYDAIKTETVIYKQGDTTLEGYLAFNDFIHKKRPGILIVHQWMGITDYEKGRARQLAKLGYVAFVIDIYGKGVRPTTPQEAAATAQIYTKDRILMRERALAGLEQIKNLKQVDTSNLAVMGYCFGGEVALELARSGADILGTISFHGLLDTPYPNDAKNIKGRVLVMNGADDPYVPTQMILDFENEMRNAGVDWMFVNYGNAVHSFTIPTAGNDNSTGSAYNEKADKRSWIEMKKFFNDIFKTNKFRY